VNLILYFGNFDWSFWNDSVPFKIYSFQCFFWEIKEFIYLRRLFSFKHNAIRVRVYSIIWHSFDYPHNKVHHLSWDMNSLINYLGNLFDKGRRFWSWNRYFEPKTFFRVNLFNRLWFFLSNSMRNNLSLRNCWGFWDLLFDLLIISKFGGKRIWKFRTNAFL